MRCTSVREQLRLAFDMGQCATIETRDHLRECAQCRAYAVELESLDFQLRLLPADEPSPAFAANVMRQVARESGLPWRWVSMVALVSLVLAAAANNYYPFSRWMPNWTESVGQLAQWLRTWSIRSMVGSWWNAFSTQAGQVLAYLHDLPSLPLAWVLPSTTAVIVCLVLINRHFTNSIHSNFTNK